MKVIIKRSKRRRKTIEARMLNGTLEVLAPDCLSESTLINQVARIKICFEQHNRPRDDSALEARAALLNEKYFNGLLFWRNIRYSKRQEKRRGSCNSHKRTIRISYRLSKMPQWVEDYVIIHELAHLFEPNHGKRFKSLVSRYDLAERAIGYLIACETLINNACPIESI
ncbi:MAG: M48 family metallopeptidase [Methanotrichaceae archaeon]|nr:M48 family metallopeptidase [Methanotrichaceae archaeon]